MSCDHQLLTEQLMDYIDGRLSGELRQRCEAALAGCEECREAHAQAQAFMRLARDWQDEPVPHWQRARFAVRPVQQQLNWLSWSALATSCLALLLVVFQLEVSTGEGLWISFGGGQRDARLREELAIQAELLRAENAALVAGRFAEFSELQSTANRLMLAEWLDRNRNERRQDMEFLMTAWESQRFRDLQRTDEQLNRLVSNQIESDQYLNEVLANVEFREGDSL